jgi:LuxR family maltose regulon positive regulatory protein
LHNNAFKASTWYAEHGLLEEAANQAEIAGDTQRAVQLAEASLRRLIDLGRNAEIVAWLGRMAPEEIETRPRFWAPAGWALANTNRGEEARSFAEAIRNNPMAGELERYEADLIQSAASAHNDDHGNWDLLPQRWPTPPKDAEPSQMLIHSVSLSHRAILSGRPEAGRQCLNMPLIAANTSRPVAPVSLSFAEALRGLSYLWEGKPLTAAGILRHGLTRAEASMDRRSRAALTLAAFLAEAALASGDAAEAARVLSQRSLIINRECIPEAVIASCTTLAELACDEGRQDRASDRISSLMEEGLARGSPRMQAAALNASSRLNARYSRLHTAGHDADRLEELCANLPATAHPAVRSFCEVQASLARATANCAAGNTAQLESAETAATRALDIANRLQRGADTARALFLRAKARDRLNKPATSEDMAEAQSICAAAGLVRLMSEFVPATQDAPSPVAAPVLARSPLMPPARQNGGLLTPREYDVVCHLANHMSNKEIAMAMGVGEETVKWHIKNLFLKLDGGDRKTVVRRARMLGIL